MQEASLSRDQPPPSKGTLGALLAGARGLNWEQLGMGTDAEEVGLTIGVVLLAHGL